jgi:hypothetical protein
MPCPYSRLSKNPPSPLFKVGNKKSPFVKGDLEGFSSAQHDFDETQALYRCPRIMLFSDEFGQKRCKDIKIMRG